MAHNFLPVEKMCYPQGVWRKIEVAVDNFAKLWRKVKNPNKSGKIAVDNPGDKGVRRVGNLGITRG